MFAWVAAERRRVASAAMSRVYVSLPLSGPTGAAGTGGAARRRAREPAADSSSSRSTPPASDRDALARDPRAAAAEDPDALAYIGGFHSSQALAAAPVLADAGLALIAPAATYSGLHGETLVG